MKRFGSRLVRCALAASLLAGGTGLTALPVAAQSAVTIVVGGAPLSLAPGPIERNGRVFVPLRGIFERLGATVVYQSGQINATKGHSTVSLTIGSTQAILNGQRQYLDVAPFIVGATTYVPLRFIAQSLGASVNYNDSTQVVSIGMPHGGPYPPPRPVPPPNPPPAPQVYLVAQRPNPGSAVTNRFATVAAQFSRPVRPAGVRVWLDGADVTYRSGVSRSGFSYAPPAPLAYGGHTVRASGYAEDGSHFDRSWSFAVAGAPPPVSPIDLRDQQPAPGATVANRFATIAAQFTRQAEAASVRVFLDGANVSNRSGISPTGFSYKPPAPLDFGAHRVRVTGNGPGGVGFDRSWTFSVSRSSPSPMHLTISQPAPNAAVTRSFTVRGNTVANGKIHLTAGATPAASGQFTANATAGPAGNFAIAVSLPALLGQQSVTVRIVATDPATGRTQSTELQLRMK